MAGWIELKFSENDCYIPGIGIGKFELNLTIQNYRLNRWNGCHSEQLDGLSWNFYWMFRTCPDYKTRSLSSIRRFRIIGRIGGAIAGWDLTAGRFNLCASYAPYRCLPYICYFLGDKSWFEIFGFLSTEAPGDKTRDLVYCFCIVVWIGMVGDVRQLIGWFRADTKLLFVSCNNVVPWESCHVRGWEQNVVCGWKKLVILFCLFFCSGVTK